MPIIGGMGAGGVGLRADCVRRSRRAWLAVAVWIFVFFEIGEGGLEESEDEWKGWDAGREGNRRSINMEEVRARGRCKVLGYWRNGVTKRIGKPVIGVLDIILPKYN